MTKTIFEQVCLQLPTNTDAINAKKKNQPTPARANLIRWTYNDLMKEAIGLFNAVSSVLIQVSQPAQTQKRQ